MASAQSSLHIHNGFSHTIAQLENHASFCDQWTGL